MAPIASEGVRRWLTIVQASALRAALEVVTFKVADLPDQTMGELIGSTVVIDVNAAGHGWFIDATARDDSEFAAAASGQLLAAANGPALATIDLLTVVLHERGHVIGLEYSHGSDLMAETLDSREPVLKLNGAENAMLRNSQSPSRRWFLSASSTISCPASETPRRRMPVLTAGNMELIN